MKLHSSSFIVPFCLCFIRVSRFFLFWASQRVDHFDAFDEERLSVLRDFFRCRKRLFELIEVGGVSCELHVNGGHVWLGAWFTSFLLISEGEKTEQKEKNVCSTGTYNCSRTGLVHQIRTDNFSEDFPFSQTHLDMCPGSWFAVNVVLRSFQYENTDAPVLDLDACVVKVWKSEQCKCGHKKKKKNNNNIFVRKFRKSNDRLFEELLNYLRGKKKDVNIWKMITRSPPLRICEPRPSY